MQNLQKNLFAIFIIIVLAIGGFLFVQSVSRESKEPSNISSEEVVSETTTLTIKDGETLKEYKVEDSVGKTALEITESATTVEKSGEGENAFITSINGRVADQSKNEFWKLVINGEDAQVGAGSYKLESGDRITWEIDTF